MKVFLVTKNERSFGEINKALAEINSVSLCGQYFEDSENNINSLLKMVSPDIIIVDDTVKSISIDKLISDLLNNFSDVGIIGLTSSHKDEFSLNNTFEDRFIKIPKPIETERLDYAFKFVSYNIKKKFVSKTLPKLRNGRKSSPKFLSFFSPKDGEGKTTLIVNLAYVLSQKYKQKVLILNLNPIFDDTDIYLNFKSSSCVSDIIKKFNSPIKNLDVLSYGIDEHPIYKNLFVISGCDFPIAFKDSNMNSEEILELFLWHIESQFDWILVDTSPSMSKDTFTILKLSQNPFVVMQNHTISIRNIEIFLKIMEKCRIDTGKFRFIATRISKNVGLKPSKLRKVIGDDNKFFSFIPSRGHIALESIVKKKPMITLTQKDDNFYRVFDAMAHELTGIENDQKNKNFLVKGIKQFFKI